MSVLLYLFALLSFAAWVTSLLTATTVLHQTVGAISFVSFAVFLTGGAIVQAINGTQKKAVQQAQSN